MLTPSLLTALLLSSGARAQQPDAGDGPIPAPKPTALIQVWATAYDMDQEAQADPATYGDPEDDFGFKIRRARVGLEGASDVLRYGVEVGVSAPYDALAEPDEDVQIVDAFVGWAPVSGLWLQGGVMKPPISREQLMSSSSLPLAERAVSSEWMVPGREVGAMVDWGTGEDTRVRVRAGAFNGNGGIFGDDNTGKLVAGRAEFATGPARTYRTWGPNRDFTLGVGADFYYDADVSTTTLGAGGDLMLRVAGFHLLAEGRFARLQPTNSDLDQPGVFSEVSRLGGLAQVGYGIGPFEPVVRFSMFDDDTASDDAGDMLELTAGLTGHLLDDLARVGGGYVLRLETGGTSIPNDTVRLWLSLRY